MNTQKKRQFLKTLFLLLGAGGILLILFINYAIFTSKLFFISTTALIMWCLYVYATLSLSFLFLFFGEQDIRRIQKTAKVACWILLEFHCALTFGLLFLKLHYHEFIPFADYIKQHVNFIPFYTILPYLLGAFGVGSAVKNLGSNLLLLLPIGLYLGCLFPRFCKARRFIPTFVLLPLCLESIQLLTQTGSFDIDDVLLNFLGLCFGMWLWKSVFLHKKLNKMLKWHATNVTNKSS